MQLVWGASYSNKDILLTFKLKKEFLDSLKDWMAPEQTDKFVLTTYYEAVNISPELLHEQN